MTKTFSRDSKETAGHICQLHVSAVKEKLTALRSHYSTAIENVNVSIEENEEAVTEALKETKTSKDELSALSKTVGFHI